ncbi:MAG: LPP20 family lipoprotein [Myxococcales bacterium]|nr:LPP20 family lipoprotein [Myxococcales bacterium]
MNRYLVVAFVGSSLVACGGGGSQQSGVATGAVTPNGPVVEYPEWVMKGSGAFGGEKRIFYGVGAASGIRNHALARTTAGGRARAELSKVFSTYSAYLMKDYSGSTTAGDMSASDEQQMVEQAIKTFSATTLTGVEIVDHWIHPTDGTIYALARMDVEGFEEMINRHRQLSAAVKERVKESSDAAFNELEEEEAKAAERP